MVRQLSGIFFIIFLTLPFLGTFIWLSHKKMKVKEAVKEQLLQEIPKETLSVLQFSIKDSKIKLRWEHNREFEYMDQMYDVVHRINEKDSITYWCWPDHRETELNRKIDQLVNLILGNDPAKKDKSQKLEEFCKQVYFNIDDLVLIPPTGPICKIRDKKYTNYLNPEIKPPTPPPKQV